MSDDKLQFLTDAFNSDGYNIYKAVNHENKVGITATHCTACINGNPEKMKKIYYLEGSHWQMGYLLGLMAEDEIFQMTTSFVNNMIWELIFWHPRKSVDTPDPNEQNIVNLIKGGVGNLIADLISQFSEVISADIPQEYLEEMDGILEGCHAVNPQTKVNKEDLWVLNFGIDWFLANIYSGLKKNKKLTKAIKKGTVKVNPPLMCNGFSLFKEAADGGHYFGRDFMFPTAGIFEKTVCMIVYNPNNTGAKIRFPFVSVTAPGLIGCISGMNIKGIGIGVEILPSAACDPEHPGFNSLLLNRYSIETGDTAESAKNVIVNAKRGVPWIYIIADGTNDKACVVEAVYSIEHISFTEFPPPGLRKGFLFWKPFLPNQKFLNEHQTAAQENGVMVRWQDYSYDQAYLEFNRKLFKRFGKTLYPDSFDKKGYINKTFKEKNCPHMYYFSPQRETRIDMVITTNHFMIPEMRYTAMDPWLAMIFENFNQDSQWRYDALNEMILDLLEEASQNGKKGVDYSQAKEILEFISPSGRYPDYYGSSKQVIEGAQSLFDLKNITIESHYGYYRDDWVKLSLRKYIK